MAKGKYARKRQLRQLRSYPLTSTELSSRIVKTLGKASICNIADLVLSSKEQLRSVPGIGDKALQEIMTVKTNYEKVDKT